MSELRRRIELWYIKMKINGLKREQEKELRFLLKDAIKNDKDPENQKYYKHVLGIK